MVLVRISYPNGSFIDVPLTLPDWNETTRLAMMQWPDQDGEMPVGVEVAPGA